MNLFIFVRDIANMNLLNISQYIAYLVDTSEYIHTTFLLSLIFWLDSHNKRDPISVLQVYRPIKSA